ncbi:MAG: hypothetical protein ABIO70_30060 [Pseudomonadota bacterium]
MDRALRLDVLIGLAAAALALAATLWALRAPAPETPRTAAAMLAAFDQDDDGAVGPEEYARVASGELSFEQLDADHDGRLAPWELEVILAGISPLQPQRNRLPRVR